MRRLVAHGKVLLAFGVAVLVLAAAHLGEFPALQGDEGALIAIESALVYEQPPSTPPSLKETPGRPKFPCPPRGAGGAQPCPGGAHEEPPGRSKVPHPPRGADDARRRPGGALMSLPVRSLRDRRELVQLRAVSQFLKAYLWVALSGWSFGVVDLIFFVDAVPSVLFGYWRLALFAAGCGLTLGSYYFLLEVSGVDAPRYRRWTLWLCVLLCVAYLMYFIWTGNTFELVFSRAILLLTASFAPLPFVALVRSLLRQFEWRKAVLLLVVLIGAWVNVMDLSVVNAGRSAAQSAYLLQLFALVWFSSTSAFLIADFSRSLAAQRAQSATMARELATQKEELSRLHALERTAREAEAAALERSRIMQDMHDGLGSQLVSSLVMARAGELNSQQTYELLRSCIDDLRLAIDTSYGTEDSLLLALGNLRFRMQPRLKAAGIALQWDTQALSNPLPLHPQAQLPVLRVVQEGLTNALKHAGAKTIKLKASLADAELDIRIEDDGRGFDVAAAKEQAAGKGLNSLEKRARVLGGQLRISSSEKGSVIWLRVPLGAPRVS